MRIAALTFALALPCPAFAEPPPEMIVQYFATSWAEITRRLPEIAAAGYTAVWLPPPTKGVDGVVDVGFSVFDRFDLGDRDQRGTTATRYGTKEDAVRLVKEAHRLGLKVFFDTVMNHNANPGLPSPGGPIAVDGFPGTVPLDYHVLPARDAGGGNWTARNPTIFGGNEFLLVPNVGQKELFVPVVSMPAGASFPGYTHLARAPWIDFNTAGRDQEMYLSLLGLFDFALEQEVANGGPAPNDGTNLTTDQPLPRLVRLPDRPETYPNNAPVPEDIREYMIRWVRWLGDTTDCDGLRLDAVKHVRSTFFGEDFPGDPVAFNKAFQESLDRRRGWAPGTANGLLYGEAFTGDVNELREYWNTGMHMLDFPLLFTIANGGGVFAQWGSGDMTRLANPQGGMDGAFQEFGGLGRNAGVAFIQSHDTDPPGAQPNAGYAFITTRVGKSVVFYDGNNHDPTSFVRPGRVDALGETGSTRITDLLDIRRRFARGGMFNRYADSDYYVYERVVPTANGQSTTLLVAITDNTTSEGKFGEFDPRPLLITEFPPGTVLEELTGNGRDPEVRVLSPTAVAPAALARAQAAYRNASNQPLPAAYGLVWLQVPAGPTNGYVAYAPKLPKVNLTLAQGGAALPTRTIQTAGARMTASGDPVAPATITASTLPSGAKLTLAVSTASTAGLTAYARIDTAQLPGVTATTGSPEGLYDGFAPMTPDLSTPGRWTLADVDVSQLQGTVHLVDVRVATSGTPTFFAEAKAFFVVAAGPPGAADAGVPGLDGGTGGPVEGGDAGPTAGPDAGAACPGARDSARPDGDGDGVSDGCDLCPATPAGTPVDDSGCPRVDQETKGALETIVQLILEERYEAAFDLNADGVVDAVDFVLRARGVQP